MDKRKQAIQRAERTTQFLENEQIKAFWAMIEADIVQMWATSKSDDADGRELCYRELHGLRALRSRLDGIIKAGRKAEEELKHEQSDRARASRQ